RGTSNALILGLFGSALIAILTVKTGSARLAGQVATGNLPDTADADLLAARLTDTWRIVLITLAVLCGLSAAATVALVRGRSRQPQVTAPRAVVRDAGRRRVAPLGVCRKTLCERRLSKAKLREPTLGREGAGRCRVGCSWSR